MKVMVTERMLAVDPGQVVDVSSRETLTVCCNQGCLWITRSGCLEDTVLCPGDCADLSGGGGIYLQSINGSARFQVRVAASDQVLPFRRVWRWLGARVRFGWAICLRPIRDAFPVRLP